MSDDKQVNKPSQVAKEATPKTPGDLTDQDLEKVAGGDGGGLDTTARTCNDAFCHEVN